MMDKDEFEKKKSLLVRRGLSTIKGLENTFKTLLKYNWYEDWEYPDKIRNLKWRKHYPVDFKFLFKRIRIIISELAKYTNNLESLWEKGLKQDLKE